MKSLLIALVGACALTVSAAIANRPNILFILFFTLQTGIEADFESKHLVPVCGVACRR